VELVTSAGEASKPQPLKAMVRLEVAEAHLDLLRSSRDLRKALVVILRRATSRASSCRSRGIFRDSSWCSTSV
jgi:hypothetical protein